MSIFHDAYLFSPNEFVDEVIPHVRNIEKTSHGYSLLRSYTLNLYEREPSMRLLSEEYGGWDATAIMTQLPEEHPKGPEDLAFWFVLLLYKHLSRTEPHRLGLGAHSDLMNKISEMLGWTDEDRSQLIRGRSFQHLIQARGERDRFDSSKDKSEYWNYFRPSSVGGRAGWLDFEDTQRLLRKLENDESKLPDLQIQAHINLKYELVEQVYHSAREMLTAAQRERRGLCLIVSG